MYDDTLRYFTIQNTPLARAQMNADIADAYRTDKLTLFYQEHDFDDFDHALKTAQEVGIYIESVNV